MDEVFTRASLWFGLAVLLIVAAALSVDQAFAVHMGISACAALIAAMATMKHVADDPEPLGHNPSRYYDDVIRWGVIATVFSLPLRPLFRSFRRSSFFSE